MKRDIEEEDCCEKREKVKDYKQMYYELLDRYEHIYKESINRDEATRIKIRRYEKILQSIHILSSIDNNNI